MNAGGYGRLYRHTYAPFDLRSQRATRSTKSNLTVNVQNDLSRQDSNVSADYVNPLILARINKTINNI